MQFNLLSNQESPVSPQMPALAAETPAGISFQRLLEADAPEALAEPSCPEKPLWVPATPDAEALRLDLWTDFGPPDEDKLCNQDAAAYAVLAPPGRGLVVALADGVSNSPYSEFGARLAVAVATRHLAARLDAWPGGGRPEPAWFQDAFEETVAVIRQRQSALWRALADSPEEFLPAGWHPRAFLPAVRHKNVLLTTLLTTVIVQSPDGDAWGFFSHVGDGAVCFRRGGIDGDLVDVLVCQPETAIDRFLGPDVERPCFPRCSYAHLGRRFVACLSTDGVARGVPLSQVLQRWHATPSAQPDNLAKTMIESLKTERPQEVADNLSLAFVSGGPQTAEG